MPEEKSSSPLLENALALNAEAFALGWFESAYHLLMGALHAAASAGDIEVVRRIAEIAREQAARLDQHHPSHLLANASAASRGHVPLFHMAEQHAHAAITRLKGAEAVEKARRRRGKVPPW